MLVSPCKAVRRPFSNGLEVLANYTWARATDTGQVEGTFGTFYGGDTPLDPNNPRSVAFQLERIEYRSRPILAAFLRLQAGRGAENFHSEMVRCDRAVS